MKENLNFYRCPICGNIVELIDGNMDRIICCGKPMIKMIANTTDAVVEKHVPVYEVIDNVVKVRGMDIVFVTTAKTNEEAYDLLKGLGMPFKK